MANGGWYGTPGEWRRLEQPLLDIDPVLEAFAREHCLAVTRNHKNHPERSIHWDNGIRCLMQLYLADEASLTFNFWLCASQDRGGERYWRQTTPRKGKRIEEFRDALPSLLRQGRTTLLQWCRHPEQFEFATRLG